VRSASSDHVRSGVGLAPVPCRHSRKLICPSCVKAVSDLGLMAVPLHRTAIDSVLCVFVWMKHGLRMSRLSIVFVIVVSQLGYEGG